MSEPILNISEGLNIQLTKPRDRLLYESALQDQYYLQEGLKQMRQYLKTIQRHKKEASSRAVTKYQRLRNRCRNIILELKADRDYHRKKSERLLIEVTEWKNKYRVLQEQVQISKGRHNSQKPVAMVRPLNHRRSISEGCLPMNYSRHTYENIRLRNHGENHRYNVVPRYSHNAWNRSSSDSNLLPVRQLNDSEPFYVNLAFIQRTIRQRERRMRSEDHSSANSTFCHRLLSDKGLSHQNDCLYENTQNYSRLSTSERVNNRVNSTSPSEEIQGIILSAGCLTPLSDLSPPLNLPPPLRVISPQMTTASATSQPQPTPENTVDPYSPFLKEPMCNLVEDYEEAENEMPRMLTRSDLEPDIISQDAQCCQTKPKKSNCKGNGSQFVSKQQQRCHFHVTPLSSELISGKKYHSFSGSIHKR